MTTFDRLFEIPADPTKKTGAYKEYLTSLFDYLMDYLSRAKPLVNIQKELENTDSVSDFRFTINYCIKTF